MRANTYSKKYGQHGVNAADMPAGAPRTTYKTVSEAYEAWKQRRGISYPSYNGKKKALL